jgi:hypothetical protein
MLAFFSFELHLEQEMLPSISRPMEGRTPHHKTPVRAPDAALATLCTHDRKVVASVTSVPPGILSPPNLVRHRRIPMRPKYRYSVTITLSASEAAQAGRIAAETDLPVTAIAKLSYLAGIGSITAETAVAAIEAGLVRTARRQRPWPGTTLSQTLPNSNDSTGRDAPICLVQAGQVAK